MFSFNDKISVRQLQILIILDVFGTGVIILPRRVAEFADQDGWIIVVLATLLAFFYTYVITSIGRLFPNDSFLTYTSKILTKPIGLLLSLGFIVKIIVSSAMELRFFGEIIKQTMLENTPFTIVCFSMLAVSGYAAAKGYETRARLAEILIFVVFVPLIIVFSIAAVDSDFTNLLPVMVAPPIDLLTGGFYCGTAFMGMEFCLLVYPYITKPKDVRKGALSAVLWVGVILVLITAITISKFGPFDVQKQMWPVLEMMDVIDLPGSFIERQDAFVMSFWIISVFAIINAGLFFSAIILKDSVQSIFKKCKIRHSVFIFICMIAIAIISFLPQNISQVNEIMDFMFMTFGVAYLIVIPIILFAVAKLRRLGRNDWK